MMMHTTNRRICAAALAACLTAALTGCVREPVITKLRQRTEISFSWWGNDTRNEYTIEAIRKFEELHPDIKVNYSYSEWSGYEARTRVRMNSNTEADVMQINFGWLSEYSPDGTGYYDLNQLSNIIDLSSYSEDALRYGMRNGVLNALPIAMNTETVYINKTLYDKYGLAIPQTWDDFFRAAKVMQKDGVYPMAGAQKAIWLYLLSYAEQQSGKTFLTDYGALNFSPKEFRLMIAMYRDMVEAKVIPQVEYYTRNDIDNHTYAGVVAWVSDAVNYFTDVYEQGDEIVIADYTDLDPAHSGQGWYAKPATLYAISENTECPNEAGMLLNYLVNSQEMALLQGVEKGIPLSKTAQDYLDAEGMLTGIQFNASEKMSATDGMVSMQPFLENGSVIDAFIDTCNQVIYERASLDDAAKALWDTAKDNL